MLFLFASVLFLFASVLLLASAFYVAARICVAAYICTVAACICIFLSSRSLRERENCYLTDSVCCGCLTASVRPAARELPE
ncbi:hypothetical protein [Methanimicrococcus hacksteinii]|uniref:hypothetical protein n=1 Tax=Methanimicrococcus hacksteinii TaxID=3028293 RepID=UPI00298EE0D3|nr:hypothetical protein [Methanimicrococcus sp. At1]